MEGFNYIIVGNSAAGVSAVEAIRHLDDKGSVAIISDEEYPIYSRCLLAYYLSGDIEEEKLLFKPLDFYERMHVKPLLGRKVVRVVPPENKVMLEDGRCLAYDKLLLATGASPKRLGIKGEHGKGVPVLRTVDDARRIISLSGTADRAVIVGGGLIGMKAAYGLNKRGLEVDVVISSNRVLSQMLDLDASNILRTKLEEHGVVIKTGLSVMEIMDDGGQVSGVRLSDGSIAPCQLVIGAKGVNPNVGLTQDSGIKINTGILTDERMKTNIENIFAAGDVAETVDLLRGERTVNALWPNAISQGRVAGQNMAGGEAKYNGSMSMNSISFYELDIISFGIVNPKGDKYETIVERDPPDYRKLVIKNGRIVGMITVGDIRNSGALLSLSMRGEELARMGGTLMGGGILKAQKIITIQGKNRVSNYS